MKTVKSTLIVLGILAVVGVIARVAYMKIQDYNKKERLGYLIENAELKYGVYREAAEKCKCFPKSEILAWDKKLEKLKTTDNDYSAHEYEWFVGVFRDSLTSKQSQCRDLERNN